MDVETFFGEIRASVTNLMTKELQDFYLVKVQMTAWIQFKAEVGNGNGRIIRVNMVGKAFNSQMMEVFRGSNLGKIIDKIFAPMRT